MESELKLQVYRLEACHNDKEFAATLKNVLSGITGMSDGLAGVLQNLKAGQSKQSCILGYLDQAIKHIEPCRQDLASINWYSVPDRVGVIDKAKPKMKDYESCLINIINYVAHGNASTPVTSSEGNLGKLLEKDLEYIGQKKAACASNVFTYAALENWEAGTGEFGVLLPLFKIFEEREKQFAGGLVGAYLERRTKSARYVEKIMMKSYTLPCVGNRIFCMLLDEAHKYEGKIPPANQTLQELCRGLQKNLAAKIKIHTHPAAQDLNGLELGNLENLLSKLETDVSDFYRRVMEHVSELEGKTLEPYELNHRLQLYSGLIDGITRPLKRYVANLAAVCTAPAELQPQFQQAKASSDKLCNNWAESYESDISRVDKRLGSAINILSREQGEIEADVLAVKTALKTIKQKLISSALKELEGSENGAR